LKSETAFFDGWDGPARVIAVQPDEDNAKLGIVISLHSSGVES